METSSSLLSEKTIPNSENQKPARRKRRISEVIESIIFWLEIVLGTRITLELFAIHTGLATHFLQWTDFLVIPFNNILPSVQIGSSNWEASSFLALVTIPFAGWLIRWIIDIVRLHQVAWRRREALT